MELKALALGGQSTARHATIGVARFVPRNPTIHWIFTHGPGMDTTIRHNNSNKGALVYGLSRA